MAGCYFHILGSILFVTVLVNGGNQGNLHSGGFFIAPGCTIVNRTEQGLTVHCLECTNHTLKSLPRPTYNLTLENCHLHDFEENVLKDLGQLRFLNITKPRGVKRIKANAFRNLEFLEQFVWLGPTQMFTLSTGAFDGLYHLKNLCIQHGRVERIEPGTFRNLSSLQNLSVIQNFYEILTPLNKDMFVSLDQVTRVNFEDCGVREINNGTFSVFPKLRDLILSANYMNSSTLKNTLTGLTIKHLDNFKVTDNQAPFRLTRDMFSELVENNISIGLFEAVMSNVESIELGTFWNLSIDTVALTDNHIKNISAAMFGGTIKNLYLNKNQIKHLNMDVFQNLVTLERLDLGENQLIFLRTNWTYLKNLKYLYLARNQFTNITKGTFLGMNNLKNLTIGFNLNLKFIDSDAFKGLTNLKKLLTFKTQITNVQKDQFRGLQKLEDLDLSSNKKLRKIHPLSLQNVPNIKSLSFQFNKNLLFKYPVFQNLSKLKRLNLDSVHIDKELLNSTTLFKGSMNIEELHMPYTNLKEFPKAIYHLTALKILDLKNNKIHHIRPHLVKTVLENYHNITEFYLENNMYHCQCNLAEFARFLNDSSQRGVDIGTRRQYICNTPKLFNGKKIFEILDKRYGCFLPKVPVSWSVLYYPFIGTGICVGLLLVLGVCLRVVMVTYYDTSRVTPVI